MGRLLAARFREQGVDLRLGVGLAEFLAGVDGRVAGVELTDGSKVTCDAALVAVGAEPVVDLVGERDGIPTDACGRTALPGVYACGDVASAWRPSASRHVRVEHWTSAAGQATSVAQAILGRERPYDDLPYFWSDQFGLRLQHVGHAEAWAAVELDGNDESFAARHVDHGGQPLAVLLAAGLARLVSRSAELTAAALAEAPNLSP